jgi:DNA-binding PadR family transcriptional regulator
MNPKRHNKRWNTIETEMLRREYELKEMTIETIASAHERSVFAILHKLKKENLINEKWSDVRGWRHPDDPYQTDVSYDYQEDDGESFDSRMQYGENEESDTESDDDENFDRSSDEDYSESESDSKSETVEKQDEPYNMEVDAVRTAVINAWHFIFMSLSYISIFYQQKIYPLFKM